MPRFMRSLNNISRAQTVYRRKRVDGEIVPAYHPYILCISRRPGATQDEIARDICTSKSTVTRRIDWFLENGYVTRIPDEQDKRCLRVYPTEKMLAVLPEIRRVAEEWTAMISDGIDEAELAVFESVLSKMEAKAREAATE